MSIPEAFQFLAKVRQDPALRGRLHMLDAPAGLEPVRRIGQAAGFTFTVDELRAAYKHDWAVRWLRYRIRDEEGSGERDGVGERL